MLGYLGFISHEWFLIARGQTHTHTSVHTKVILKHQTRASIWPACAWFKNIAHCIVAILKPNARPSVKANKVKLYSYGMKADSMTNLKT